MIPYILCLFPILLVAVFPTKKKASQQSKHFILALMPLALLMAFKSKYVGADTINSVSYTHLDVYKRQLYIKLMLQGF